MSLNHEAILAQCPVCAKNRKISNLRFFYINFDEKVLLCTDKECPFPYGFEEFKYMKSESRLIDHEKLKHINLTDESTVTNIEKKSEEIHNVKNATIQLCKNAEIIENCTQNEKINMSSIDKVTDLHASSGCNVKNIEIIDDVPSIKINQPLITKIENEINGAYIFKSKLSKSPKIAKTLNLISSISKLHQTTRKIDSKAEISVSTSSIKSNNSCLFNNKVSRFPKFSFKIDNIDNLKDSEISTLSINRLHKTDTLNDENLQRKELTTIDNHDNINSNDFINEFIDNICSQPNNVNRDIDINDDFLQDVIGM